MEFQSILIALLLAWTLVRGLRLLVKRSSSAVKKLPPGPFPLPVIGNLHLLGNQPHRSLARLAKKHGPIMKLKLGMIDTVVISSSTVAKEVLQKQDLAFSSMRFVPDVVRANDHNQFSVIWLPTVSSKWRTLRKIMNSHIFSSTKLDANQHLRAKKIQDLIMFCQKKSQVGEAVDIGLAAFMTNLNLISNTVLSKDLWDPSSDSAKEFRELVSNIAEVIGKPNVVDFFPFLEMFDPQGIRRSLTALSTKVLHLFGDMIDERLENRKMSGNKNDDVLDSLLNISQEKSDEINRTDIQNLLLDLFTAGSETISSTLEWAMTELFKSPETMVKAQVELADVIGKGKPLNESDITRLPYLQCIVKETFRMHPAAPLLLPRKVVKDMTLCGYTTPKDSQILVNAYAIGHDPSIWEDPLIFNPERFWNLEMDVKGQDFELIPFGVGRRICPGLPLAVRMVPMMLGSLLNSFKWKLEGDIAPKDLDMEEKFGTTVAKALPLRAIPIPL